MRATNVTSGASAEGSVHAGPFRVSTATFGPALTIPSHFHEWACISVLLEGRFEQRFPGRWCDCPPGVVLSKPPGERHVDRWFDGWSRHLIIEVDPERHAELGPSRPLAEEIFHAGGIGAEPIAAAAWRELERPDDVTPVLLHGLVLQLLGQLQRRVSPRGAGEPPWLGAVRDYLHAHYRSSVRLADLAELADVHVDHVSRAFTAAHRVSVGAYVRRLRVEEAARLLASSDESISRIAHRTGFSDQSHLTRVFGRLLGVTPGRYRRSLRD